MARRIPLSVLVPLFFMPLVLSDYYGPDIKFGHGPLHDVIQEVIRITEGGISTPRSNSAGRAIELAPILQTSEGLFVVGYDGLPAEGALHGIQLHDQSYGYTTDRDGFFLALSPKVEQKVVRTKGKSTIQATGPTVHVTGQPVIVVPDKQALLELYLDGRHVDGHLNPRLKVFFVHSSHIYNHGYHPVHFHSKTGPVFLPLGHHDGLAGGHAPLHPTIAAPHFPPFLGLRQRVLFDPVQGVVLQNGPPVLKTTKVLTDHGSHVSVVTSPTDKTLHGKSPVVPGAVYSNVPVYSDAGIKQEHKHQQVVLAPVPPFFYFLTGGICP